MLNKLSENFYYNMRKKSSVGRSLKALLAVSFFCMYVICFIIVDAVIDVVIGFGVVGTCGVVDGSGTKDVASLLLMMLLEQIFLFLCC